MVLARFFHACLVVAFIPSTLADCTFAIRDLQLISPVPVRAGQFITPTRDGHIELQTNHSLDLYCSTHFKNYAADLISVNCAPGTDNLVRISGINIPLTSAQLECRSNNIHSNVDTSDAPLIHIGYNINGSHSPLIETAFNASVKRAIYSHHEIVPVLVTGQQVVTSAFPKNFRADKLFDASDDTRFTFDAQRQTICNDTLHLLPSECDAYFEKSRRFLARGHLAPAADFIYLSAKRATYSLINVAPQWQQLNNGPWKQLEAGVRAKCLVTNDTLDVFTGTLGTLRLRDSRSGVLTELYLNAAAAKMPVPAMFFKIVVNRSSAKGVVFLAVNNPMATEDEVQRLKESARCSDVADTMTWPRSLWFNGTDRIDRTTAEFRSAGYMFACAVKDFAQDVDGLPLELQSGDWELFD